MHKRKIMQGFEEITPINKALTVIFNNVHTVKKHIEHIPISRALGRVVAKDIVSPEDHPLADRSVVDGYALNFEDTTSASTVNPIEFKLVNNISGEKQAIEVYTGTILPLNTNAVIMVEDTTRDNNTIKIYKSIRKFENVSLKGEDFKQGEMLIEKYKLLKPHHLAALYATGVETVPVFAKLKVGVLSTGSELLGPSPKVRNSTGPFILSLLNYPYIEPVNLGVVGDESTMLRKKIDEALKKVDILITTGGTGPGKRDLVPDVLDTMGKVYFNGVNSRPGKTAGFAVIEHMPVFFISGFPVAAMVSFDIFIKPFINKVLRLKETEKLIVSGYMKRKVANPSGVRSYLRVKVYKDRDKYIIEPLRITGSGLISSLTRANGVVIIPEYKEGLEEEECVKVMLFDTVGE